MDASVLLLKREEIQQRMEARRVQASSSSEYSVSSRLLPWVLTTGLGLVTGLRATRKNYGWLGSAAAAVILPALMGFARRKTEPDGFVHRILRAVFPAHNV